MSLFLLVLALSVGYVMGYLSKGITVNVNRKEDIPEGYNESLANELDPQVRQYLDQNNGLNKF